MTDRDGGDPTPDGGDPTPNEGDPTPNEGDATPDEGDPTSDAGHPTPPEAVAPTLRQFLQETCGWAAHACDESCSLGIWQSVRASPELRARLALERSGRKLTGGLRAVAADGCPAVFHGLKVRVRGGAQQRILLE